MMYVSVSGRRRLGRTKRGLPPTLAADAAKRGTAVALFAAPRRGYRPTHFAGHREGPAFATRQNTSCMHGQTDEHRRARTVAEGQNEEKNIPHTTLQGATSPARVEYPPAVVFTMAHVCTEQQERMYVSMLVNSSSSPRSYPTLS